MRKSGFSFFRRRRCANALRLQALGFLFFVPNGFAQEAYQSPSTAKPPAEPPPETAVSALKKLPLEELMDIEITSASRRPEKLSETSSAVDVITGEDI